MLNGKNNRKITNKNDSKLSAGTTLIAECQVIEGRTWTMTLKNRNIRRKTNYEVYE